MNTQDKSTGVGCTPIKDKFYLRFNYGGYRRKPKFELRNIQPEGLGNLIASLGEEHKEYAEFIVLACNSHYALVEALKGIREHCPCDPDINQKWYAAWQAMLAALSLTGADR
jgi:hypothetical protein